eukprot:gene28804-32530_t
MPLANLTNMTDDERALLAATTGAPMTKQEQLIQWIDAHFDEQVAFLQQVLRVPTDTPPGNNAPHAERTAELLAAMGSGARALLREKGTPYAELDLANPKWTDDELLDFMLAHPVLINRPIVETPLGTRLCRPSELVLDILPNAQQGAFSKEDGEA